MHYNSGYGRMFIVGIYVLINLSSTKLWTTALYNFCNVPSCVKTLSKRIIIIQTHPENRQSRSCKIRPQQLNSAFAVISWFITIQSDLHCCFPFHSYFNVCRHLATRRMHKRSLSDDLACSIVHISRLAPFCASLLVYPHSPNFCA